MQKKSLIINLGFVLIWGLNMQKNKIFHEIHAATVCSLGQANI